MAKYILLTILISIFLTSCIAIKEVSEVTTPRPNFVTATLAPTKIELQPVAFSLPPETATPATAVPANCTNAAVLLQDVTIQDDTHVNAGEKITKTWEFQNTGTCPWVDATIRFSAGDRMNAPVSALIADTLPNGNVQVSLGLTAPTAAGTYAGYFSLLDANGEVIPIGTQTTFWVRFIVGAYAVLPAASGANPAPSGNCIHSQNANVVSETLVLINTERADAGLQALSPNPEMTAFAQSHAEDMAYNNFLSHDGSDGSFGERMAGYSMTNPGFQISGELLAIGTPQNAMDQWRKDEHWDYVLGSFTRIGVGYAYNSCSDFGGYITVDLGA